MDQGATVAVVTDGANEVAAADATRSWRASVPTVAALNPVGSGDAFDAAFSLALLAGTSIETALARGVAAGSANALALGAGMLDASVAHQLESRVSVTSTRR